MQGPENLSLNPTLLAAGNFLWSLLEEAWSGKRFKVSYLKPVTLLIPLIFSFLRGGILRYAFQSVSVSEVLNCSPPNRAPENERVRWEPRAISCTI